MKRPSLNTAGDRVRVPVGEQLLAPLLDALAIAYAENPVTVGHLLARHAASVLRSDHAECSEDAPDHVRALLAAEADGTRGALLDELPADVSADPLLTAEDAAQLAEHLTSLAAYIGRTTLATIGIPA